MSTMQFDALVRYIDTVPLTQAERRKLGEYMLGTSSARRRMRRINQNVPNDTTLQAIEDAKAGRNMTVCNTWDEFLEALK